MAALGTRSIICVSVFPPMCMARLLIKDLFSLYVQQVNSTSISKNWCQFDRVFVFHATLLLVTLTLLSGAENIWLISHMTSIEEEICDVTYRRKTFWASSSKLSAPIGFRRCTVTGTDNSGTWQAIQIIRWWNLKFHNVWHRLIAKSKI